MWKVALCDDDACFGENALALIKKCAPVEVETVYFPDAAAFLRGGAGTDILFLDIDMPGVSGMDLAQSLQEKKICPIIVFLTGLAEYVYDAFAVEAAGYLLKPLKEETLKPVLFRALKKAETLGKKRHLTLKKNGEVYLLPVEDILYVENQGRKLVFHTDTVEIAVYGRMEDYEKQLPDYFFRCHRGYLISLKEVVSYEKNLIRLTNGEEVLMAKKRYEAFLQACIAWLQ